MPQIEAIQAELRSTDLDGWLFYDFHHRDPIAARVLGLSGGMGTRRWFYLIQISEMTWSRRMKHPSKVVKPNDQVEAVVLEVHPKERRISLGLKQLEPNPWTTIDTRYSVGSVVEGRVRNMTDFGAFIEIEEGIDGLVHVSDLYERAEI